MTESGPGPIGPMTPGAARLLAGAERRARIRGGTDVTARDLLHALLDEPDCRAGSLLTQYRADLGVLGTLAGWGPLSADAGPEDDEQSPVPHATDLRLVLHAAAALAREAGRGREVGTEHLLLALAAPGGPHRDELQGAGLEVRDLLSAFEASAMSAAAPIAIEDDAPRLDLGSPSEGVDLLRILDAAANRAGEGLRVVEDYARFVLDDGPITKRLKEARHRLAEALRGLPIEDRLAARDTPGDVGTHIALPSERHRESPRAVLAANFRRTEEALRSLEEYAKLVDVWLAGRFEVLRYDVYTLEKLTLTAVLAHESLGGARLYVLVGGQPTLGELTWVVREALAGGAQVIQLREKGLADREALTRAREVRLLTIEAGARLIINDRPDLARLASADGAHLGQEDLAPRDARRVLGPRALIGVSTHDLEQLRQAPLAGAQYLGVGPVFPSRTKDFAGLAGLAFVRQAAESATLPWFAIGGIDASNLDAVLAAGAQRIAVSSAVVGAPSPRRAARALRDRLDELG